MRIDTKHASLSIVDAVGRPDHLVVTAGRPGAIEAIFPDYADCVRAGGAAGFRAEIPRHIVAAEIAGHIVEIDYPVFTPEHA